MGTCLFYERVFSRIAAFKQVSVPCYFIQLYILLLRLVTFATFCTFCTFFTFYTFLYFLPLHRSIHIWYSS